MTEHAIDAVSEMKDRIKTLDRQLAFHMDRLTELRKEQETVAFSLDRTISLSRSYRESIKKLTGEEIEFPEISAL